MGGCLGAGRLGTGRERCRDGWELWHLKLTEVKGQLRMRDCYRCCCCSGRTAGVRATRTLIQRQQACREERVQEAVFAAAAARALLVGPEVRASLRADRERILSTCFFQ